MKVRSIGIPVAYQEKSLQFYVIKLGVIKSKESLWLDDTCENRIYSVKTINLKNDQYQQ